MISISLCAGFSIEEKLETICTKIYHADGVQLTPTPRSSGQLTALGFDKMPICMAIPSTLL
jgi:formate--tetrahydrofolate ligase